LICRKWFFLGACVCIYIHMCILIYLCVEIHIYTYVSFRNFLSTSEWFIFISWLSFLSFNENDYILSVQIQGWCSRECRQAQFVCLPFFPLFFFDWVPFTWRPAAAGPIFSLLVPCSHVSVLPMQFLHRVLTLLFLFCISPRFL